MRKLLNTLYVTNPDSYLSLDGENIVVKCEEQTLGRVPLHNLESIVTFGYTGASPALMGACAKANISICFMKASGRFLASVVGETTGNVILRKTQYRLSDNEADCVNISRNMLIGKLHNSRHVLERYSRDYALRLDADKLKTESQKIKENIDILSDGRFTATEELRGIEGKAAQVYFGVFDDLILQNKADFFFTTRSRRPPLDNVNALLSFMYSILSNEVSAALSAVGLDPFVGFLHKDRPGRRSLALDVMEELRAPVVDRFVLSLINNRQVQGTDFLRQDSGAVLMKDDTRKQVIAAWQKRKQEELVHPFLKEKVPWGLVPHCQALLLARFIRGDVDEYPPFLWK
jgi:CRISPR-associated protein Cas1